MLLHSWAAMTCTDLAQHIYILCLPMRSILCICAECYRDLPGVLFAAKDFQEVVLAYYAHITRQKGVWTPDKATVLLTPKELAYVDLCVNGIPSHHLRSIAIDFNHGAATE